MLQKNSEGFLISFEGGEGSGKSTQIALLEKCFLEAGHEVVTLREPGGTTIGEQIRAIVLGSQNPNISFATEVLLFQAQRAQLYHEVVLPKLAEGCVVLMDRTRDSSVVYQGIVRRFGKDLIEELNTIATQDTYPNMTFLLDVSVEVGLGRRHAENGTSNRIDNETRDFHEQVREAYLELAREDVKGRWVILSGEQPVEKIAKEVWHAVSKRIS